VPTVWCPDRSLASCRSILAAANIVVCVDALAIAATANPDDAVMVGEDMGVIDTPMVIHYNICIITIERYV
jgi:hypothetical protein